ncbi:MAG: 3-ketoacyl-ACP reductase [Spirochaetia bacterium]|jgi:NAD(P)-dependent dehydrogenase (short-subunit alcohol dehydrogenase family)|nr:3-ketoacyl-ACP reductase [Spirochaetia bacterium]
MKKTAIVTGGSKGIGFAIARQLGLDGYNIAIIARSTEEKNQENLAVLSGQGTPWLYVQGSIDSREDRQRLLGRTVERFGGVHLLVNNAGVAPLSRTDLLEMSEESFDRVIGINTKATMFLTQLVAKQMLKQKAFGNRRGTIINVSSCSAVVSSTNRGEYCVSKAGVSMLTTLYADRLAREGILVHEVRPGVIATDMTSGVKEKYDALFASGAFPIARWGTPEDVANAVSALASEKFLYTTGNYIDIDGGFHIRHL